MVVVPLRPMVVLWLWSRKEAERGKQVEAMKSMYERERVRGD